MAESRLQQTAYKLKNTIVRCTGPFGKKLEQTVAKRWIADIEAAIDAGNKATMEKDSLLEANPDAFAEYERRRRQPERKDPCICEIVHSLAIGGGEIFPVHLANCLWDMGYPVILIDCGMREEDPKIRGLVRKDLPLLTLNGLEALPTAISQYGIEIAHSHHAMIDLAVSRMIRSGMDSVHQVITLHGMYENLDKPRRQILAQRTSETADAYAYIADKNLDPFNEAGVTIDSRFVKLPNGLPSGVPDKVSRSELGIGEHDFVLCLVSRAIWQKGWKEAIDAVILANRYMQDNHAGRSVQLILVGDGEAYDRLKKIDDPHIHFVGAQQDTRKYLAAADMGFLPSRYKGESFPLSLIDSFMCGKPVIATSIGEIPVMIRTPHGKAGCLFPLTDKGAVPVRRLAKTIVHIAQNEKILRNMSLCAKEAAERYNIKTVAERYADLFRKMADNDHAEDRKVVSGKNVKILISCHKPASVLKSEVFTPIQVGTALADKRFPYMLYDDEGENISTLNRSYCELTAQYWAWKNLQADYLGFFHYRRYLNLSGQKYREDRYGNVYEPVLSDNSNLQKKLGKRYGWTDANVRNLMESYDVVTIEKRPAGDKPGQMTVRQQYDSAPYLFGKDLDCVLDIIKEKYPDYLQDAETYLNGTEAYFCNMYICRRDIFDDYCRWLFPILEEFCRRTDMSCYDTQQLRTPGHLAERLWGVYFSRLKKNGAVRTGTMQCVVFSHTDQVREIQTAEMLRPLMKALHSVTAR